MKQLISQAQQRKKIQEDEAYKARIYEMKRVLREYRNKTSTTATPSEEQDIDADPIVDLKHKEKHANDNIWSTGEVQEMGGRKGWDWRELVAFGQWPFLKGKEEAKMGIGEQALNVTLFLVYFFLTI